MFENERRQAMQMSDKVAAAIKPALAVSETAAVITHRQAGTIAAELRGAGMDVMVRGAGRGPIFTNCTGTQIMATIVALVARGELPLPFLIGQDWQTVSFEESTVDGHWSSIELTFAD